jgi:protein-tyrosine phosphatase
VVDIHSHILYGLDDGAADREQSLAMLEMAAAGGTTDIVATPHANIEYKWQPDLIEERIADLQSAAGGSIRIHRGCDFHLAFDNIQNALEHPNKYTINHRNYLLVEFGDLLIPKTTGEVFRQMLNAGIVPVITHPERNQLLQLRLQKLEEWVAAGCLLQVTALSFLGRFGRRAKSFSDLLLKKRMVHVVASDAHDTKHRPPVLGEARRYVEKAAGEALAEALFVANPAAMLTGAPVEIAGPAPEVKKWYRFW